MCGQNGTWEDESIPETEQVLVNELISQREKNYTFENGDSFVESESKTVAFWHAVGEPDASGRYLVGVKTDKNIKIEIADYFKRDDHPNLSRWSDHIKGKVVCWADLPVLPALGIGSVVDYHGEKDDIGEAIWEMNPGKQPDDENCIYTDFNTGLEWVAGPDENISFVDATALVGQMNKDNYKGGNWRLPRTEELGGLYVRMKGILKNSGILKTTGEYIWSDKTNAVTMAYVLCILDGRIYPFLRSCYSDVYNHVCRVFAVRTIGK